MLNDLLDDWKAGFRPPFEGLRVIGSRWSLQDHRLRTFLSSNHVPYRWLDIAGNEEAAKLMAERGLKPEQLPAVLFADGTTMPGAEPDAARHRDHLHIQISVPPIRRLEVRRLGIHRILSVASTAACLRLRAAPP